SLVEDGSTVLPVIREGGRTRSPTGSVTEVDDGIVTLRRHRSSRRDGWDGRLSYAALSGSCALGFVSSSLRPTSRSDRPTSTAAPSRTNPATTGTDIATAVSREPRRTPSRPTSLTVMAAS